jgi:DNA invertase Pin-like site-specific DNA recombinase
MDFAKLVEVFDRNNVTFVSVTQCRLTLNILLSFAQFEPEVIGERIRDKFAASRKTGMWMGGFPQGKPLALPLSPNSLTAAASAALSSGTSTVPR